MNKHSNSDPVREQIYRSTELCLRDEISDEEMDRLETLLQSGEEPLSHFLEYIAQSAALGGWAMALAESQETAHPLVIRELECETNWEPRRDLKREPSRREDKTIMPSTSFGWAGIAGVLALTFLFGAGTSYFLQNNSAPNIAAPNDGMRIATEFDSEAGPYPPNESVVARLVSHTGSVWNASSHQPLNSGDPLLLKETVTLQEGIATFELVSGLTLDLEGPAVVSVDPDGAPVVQYGKVVASLPWGAKQAVVRASLGDVQLDGNDVAGIGAFGSGLSLYVFRGEVAVGARTPEEEPLVLTEGHGKSLSISSAGIRYTLMTPPKSNMFASWNSINSDQLLVSDAYVASVRKSQPIGYWRFEEVIDGQVLNEVSDKHHGSVGGKVRLVSQMPKDSTKNHVAEFGFGLDSGYLLVDEPFDQLAGTDYAFEVWVKPNHFHRSVIANLVELRTHDLAKEGNAFLLETLDDQGRRDQRPYSLRFLHRSPPSPHLHVGKSCYSSREYDPRKWQHLVAVKEGHNMSLYVNGEVLGEGEDRTDLVSGLNLVVGRLYSFEPVRPFVGQIDELSVYDHSLSDREIKSRYHLLR